MRTMRGRASGWAVSSAVVLGLVLAPGLARAQATETAGDGTASGVIFLVRHGETTPDGTRDPALSPEGRERAERLAALLVDARLDGIYSTDYLRTRGTAAALADRLRVEPRIYDPGRLRTFARALREQGGRVLVVGHSNTTPALVEALGGEAGSAMDEAEHDRLYILFLQDGAVRTVLLRY